MGAAGSITHTTVNRRIASPGYLQTSVRAAHILCVVLVVLGRQGGLLFSVMNKIKGKCHDACAHCSFIIFAILVNPYGRNHTGQVE